MPYVEPNTITDIDRKQRKVLQALLFERAVMAYAFSWKKLFALAVKITEASTAFTPEELTVLLMDTVLAFNEDDAKEAKAQLNDQIASILDEYEIKTLRDEDPFGRAKDYIIQNGNSTSCPRARVIDCATKLGIDATKLALAFENATETKPFVTVQARDVKEKEPEATPAPRKRK